MFAIGCIQSLICNTNRCPTGVATQDPLRQRALVVGDKAERVANFHRNTLRALSRHDSRRRTPASLRKSGLTTWLGASATPRSDCSPSCTSFSSRASSSRESASVHFTAMPGISRARTVSTFLNFRPSSPQSRWSRRLRSAGGHCCARNRYQGAARRGTRSRVQAVRSLRALVGAREANDICIFSR